MRIVFLLCFLIFATKTHAYVVVLNAIPDSKVVSTSEGVDRLVLPGKQLERQEYKLVIPRRNGKYYWASREGKELVHITSGAVTIFLRPGGTGYIEIYDKEVLPEFLQPPGKRYFCKEHVRNMLLNVTYWG